MIIYIQLYYFIFIGFIFTIFVTVIYLSFDNHIIVYDKNKSVYRITNSISYNKTILIDSSTNRYVIKTNVAADPKSRAEGLSGTASLCEDCGKYFIFDKEGYYPFWMKEMNYDLDIIYIDKDNKIVNIFENVKKESYPDVIENSMPAKYVLEVNSGIVAEYGMGVGDGVELVD